MKTIMNVVQAMTAGVTAASALAHYHITVDTLSGAAGDPISIRAGYYPSEALYSIDEAGRLLFDGEPAVLAPENVIAAGSIAGWLAESELTLTSDFYFSTGHLNGGDFRYELAQVVALGDSPDAVVAWGSAGAGGNVIVKARSDAAEREGRSFAVGVGAHPHGQVSAINAQGIYDLVLVAWDKNGKFVDSAPVYIRVSTDPADIDRNGCVNDADLGLLLNAFGQTSGGDINSDGATNDADLGLLLNAWNTGCN